MNRRQVPAAGVAFSPALSPGTAMAAEVSAAMVVRALGIGFFEAARKGGEEAAKEPGNVKLRGGGDDVSVRIPRRTVRTRN